MEEESSKTFKVIVDLKSYGYKVKKWSKIEKGKQMLWK